MRGLFLEQREANVPAADMVSTAYTVPGAGLDSAITTPFESFDLRNAAGAARSSWEARYVRTLTVADFLIGMAAAGGALLIRFGNLANQPYNRYYLWLTIALPIVWLFVLTINRAYEVRYLFVGTDEYERV